jgi:hypothetical protein
MRNIAKFILFLAAGAATLLATTAFIISDPQADFIKPEVSPNDPVHLSDIQTKNSEVGAFKTSVEFKQNSGKRIAKEFYGMEIAIQENPQVEKIRIGVTSNLLSRVEIWNQDQLVKSEELGFMKKMTWGQTQTLSVEFYDQTHEKYKGKSQISMRFYDGTGFWGDIGTLNLGLTAYGDMSTHKSIGVFASSLDSSTLNKPEFSDLQIWKNYRSFD